MYFDTYVCAYLYNLKCIKSQALIMNKILKILTTCKVHYSKFKPTNTTTIQTEKSKYTSTYINRYRRLGNK